MALSAASLSVAAPTERTTTYTYHTAGMNGAGQIASMEGPLPGAGDTTNYTYDTDGNLSAITNPLGHVTQLLDYTLRRRPGRIIDANGVETLLGYHARGWVNSVTVVSPGGGANAVTLMTYDAVGQLTRMTLPDGSFLDFEYDNAQRLTAIQNGLAERIEYTLDNAGNRTTEVIKNSIGAIVKTQTRVFNQMSQLIKNVGASAQETVYGYDSQHNLTSVTDHNTNLTAYGFDALNRLVSQTDPYTANVQYSYDSRDRIKTVTDQRGLVTTYSYDAFDNLISQSSPDTGVTDYEYDNAGNRIQQTDARGVVVNFSYDNLNRLTSATYPASTSENVTYTYDSTSGGNYGVGRLTGIIDESGQTNLFYDHRGNLVQKSYTVASTIYSLSYSYDVADNLIQVTYPSGRIVDYSRDTEGRVSGITTKDTAGSPAETVLSNVTYLPFGPLSGYVYGNGLTHTMAYDQDYRVDAISTGASPSVIDLDYGYDNNSNITVIDNLSDASRNQDFQYDDVNRLTQAIGVYGQVDYAYDDVGNRTQRTIALGGATTVEDYNYSGTSNRLSSVDVDDGATITTRALTYDAAGNSTRDDRASGDIYDLDYNSANRYAAVDLNSGTSPRAEYVYNAFGQRVSKVARGLLRDIHSHYHYDEQGLLIAITTDSGALKREYIYLEGQKVATLMDDDYAGEELETGPVDNNVVQGSSSAETLAGTSGDDTVIGLEDNDVLSGDAGNDILVSGPGNDSMAGDAGDDTYHWGRGEGNDSIDDSNSVDAVNPSHVDRVLFGYGITQADLNWQRQGNNLLFTLPDTGETLQVTDYYLSVDHRVEQFQLRDGTVLSTALWDSL
ncbi:MAG: calcium-binding protein [Pseudomonadota bacterium]